MKLNPKLVAALAVLSFPAVLAAQQGQMRGGMEHPGDQMSRPMGGQMDRRPMAGDEVAVPTPVYLMKAGASDLFERQSGQLLSSSHNPGVARFARDMVRDHTNSTAMVKAAAMRAGLHPRPPMLDRDMMRDMAALRAARGPERDRLYVMQQKKAHQAALMLQQGYVSSGDKPSLRMAAGKIVPVVQHHIAMLERM